MPNTRSGRGMRCDEALYYRSVSSKGAGRPRLTHHHKGRWNETKCMRWVWRNGGMKFVVRGKREKPEKNLPRPRFVHHETHRDGPRHELGTPAVVIIININHEIYAKYWVNLKQLMRNSEILWRKSKKLTPKKKNRLWACPRNLSVNYLAQFFNASRWSKPI